jgi:hypothetical protein
MKLLTLLLLFLLNTYLFSQTKENVSKQVWFDYYQFHTVDVNFQYYGNVGIYSAINNNKWLNIFIRPAIKWIVNPNLNYSGGIGLYYTNNFGIPNNTEFRIWEGVSYVWPKFTNITFIHLLKAEQRFNFPTDTWDLEFSLRMRYKLSSKIFLHYINKKGGEFLYLPYSAELFFQTGEKITEQFNDKIRLTIGLGYKINFEWTFETIYTYQSSRESKDNYFQASAHLFQFNLKRYL